MSIKDTTKNNKNTSSSSSSSNSSSSLTLSSTLRSSDSDSSQTNLLDPPLRNKPSLIVAETDFDYDSIVENTPPLQINKEKNNVCFSDITILI